MRINRTVFVDKKEYSVLISDEQEALSAAYAAKRAIIGIWHPKEKQTGEKSVKEETSQRETDYSHCLYLVTDPSEVDETLLERAVRRQAELPWIIGTTNRLLIREFCSSDPLEPISTSQSTDPMLGTEEEIFRDFEKRDAYIKNQYRFCECGIWAVLEKTSGNIIGKAGITDGELSYHIYEPFRKKGYAFECCKEILMYAEKELECPEVLVRIKKGNEASCFLAEKLGFIYEKEENGILFYRLVF